MTQGSTDPLNLEGGLTVTGEDVRAQRRLRVHAGRSLLDRPGILAPAWPAPPGPVDAAHGFGPASLRALT